MAYSSLAELPESIRAQLPEPAQELYRAAYNRELEKLEAAEGHTDSGQSHHQADQAAWRRVTMEYQKDEQGVWQAHSIGDDMDKDNIRYP